MVDTATSKAAAARREGSTPSWGTMSSGLCSMFFDKVPGIVRFSDRIDERTWCRIQKTELDRSLIHVLE